MLMNTLANVNDFIDHIYFHDFVDEVPKNFYVMENS